MVEVDFDVLGVELIEVVILFVVEMLFIDVEIIGDVSDRVLVVNLTELVVEVEVVVLLTLDWKDGVDVITELLHGLLIPSPKKSWIKENQNSKIVILPESMHSKSSNWVWTKLIKIEFKISTR